jgi:hypothetical protein
LLRLWDFSKADTRYASEEGRSEIAGREQNVIGYLVDRKPELETVLIRPRISDPEKGIHYWEVFERRRQLRRLRDFVTSHASELTGPARVGIARALLSHVSAMHRLGAAHLDVGSHSVWIELPSTVRLSHLLAASYPDLKSLGDRRYEFLSGATPLPEDVLGGSVDHLRKDVFLLAAAVHTVIFGRPPQPQNPGDPPDWDDAVDGTGEFDTLHSWFKRGLDHSAAERFGDAQEMLDAFNSATESKEHVTALERLQRFRRWKSILEVQRAFPVGDVVAETERVLVWRSDVNERRLLVKAWRRSSWGEERAEAPRLLRFCEEAEDLILAAPDGVARITQVGYIADYLVLVQEFVEAPNLSESLLAEPGHWAQIDIALPFLLALVKLVNRLHDSGRSHGDLKPSNILVVPSPSAGTPLLIDLLDFAGIGEGEIRTPAYAPAYGAGAREREGYLVEGFAPTSRAAHKLAEVGIETSTIQHHLARGDDRGPAADEKRLYVLDESSLASTKQMHTFLERLGPDDRVLLVGDVRQHEAVDAGRPYHQLQEAGIRTAHLDEIVRQRDPELKAVVEQLSWGDVHGAVERLDQQGRVHEIAPREERLSAIANEYVKDPQATLVVSPDNQSRQDLNDVIHRAMQSEGHVDRDEHRTPVLAPRQEITGADRQWAERYEQGDVVRYSRGSKALGIEAGDYAHVEGVDSKNNQVTVRTDDERAVNYDPRRLQGVTLYRETERAFAERDRVQMTAPDRARGVPNRELGTIERIDTNGRVEVRWDSGRTSSFEASERRHLDYGYAVTSHSSQGQTAGRVLVHVETDRASEKLVNQRLAYVAVSRGQYDARIYTDDKVRLPRALDRDVSHGSALERTPTQVQPQSESRETSRSESSGHSVAVGST